MEGSRLTGVYRFLTPSKESASRRMESDGRSISQPIRPQSNPESAGRGKLGIAPSGGYSGPAQKPYGGQAGVARDSSTSNRGTSRPAQMTDAATPAKEAPVSHDQKSTLELAEFLRISNPEEFKRYTGNPGDIERPKNGGSEGFLNFWGRRKKSSIEIVDPLQQSLPGFVEQNSTAEGRPYYSVRVEQRSDEANNSSSRVPSVRNVPYAGSDQDADYYLDKLLSSHEHADTFGAASPSEQQYSPYVPFSAPSRSSMAKKDYDPHRMHRSLLPGRGPAGVYGSRTQQEVVLGSRASSRTLVEGRPSGSTASPLTASRRPSWQSDRPTAGPPPNTKLPPIPQMSETGSVRSSRRSLAPSTHRTKSISSANGSASTNASRILILEETEHEQREREIRMLQRKLHDMDTLHASTSAKLRQGNLEEALNVLSGGTARPQQDEVASSQDMKRLSAQLQDLNITFPQSPKSSTLKPQTPPLTDRPQSLTESDSSWGSTRKHPHIDQMIGTNSSESELWGARLKALQDKNALLERALLCVLQEKSRGADTTEMEELILSQITGEQAR